MSYQLTEETIDMELEKGATVSVAIIRALKLLKKFKLGVKLGIYRLIKTDKPGNSVIEMTKKYSCGK